MLMLLKVLFAAPRPAQSQLHRSFRTRPISGILRAFIKRHNNIRAQADLRLHRALWPKEVWRAIEVRTKRHAFFGDLAQLVQAENLESAGIGQDGLRPRHEAMQPAQPSNGFDSRTQVEVIGIAEKNLDAEFFQN